MISWYLGLEMNKLQNVLIEKLGKREKENRGAAVTKH